MAKMKIKEKLSTFMYMCFSVGFFVDAFISCGIILTLNWIFFWHINKKWYRKIASYCGYTMYSQSVFMLRWWANTDVQLYIDKEVYEKYLGKEHSLCILNHSGELDWIVFCSLLDKLNILGNMKAYIKNEVFYIPFVGWGFYLAEFIMVTRSYEKDKVVLKKGLQALADYEEPVSLLLFPEGTRFTPKKHEQALKFSRERGLRELQHHLVPRTKGFTASINYMRGKFPAIYDIEIAFEGLDPKIKYALKGNNFKVHVHLKRIPLEQVPIEEHEQEKYLQDMFYQKDKMMDSFKKTGDFYKLSGVERYEPISVSPHTNSLFNSVFWMTLTWGIIIYYFVGLVLAAQYLYICIFIFALFLSYIVLYKSIDNMQVKEKN